MTRPNPDPRRAETTATRCPVCRGPAKPSDKPFPFCSERCRSIDLGRWFDEKYVISRPIEQSDLDEGE